MKKILILTFLFINLSLIAQEQSKMNQKMTKTDTEWKEILSPQQYHVLREKGTDRPGDFGYTNTFDKGSYFCAACNAQLFESNTKYESHCGWPSFDDAIKGAVNYIPDDTLGMVRTEITCAKCDGHLGHIFDDGPKETTGKRYCVNTTSIKFVKSQ